MQTDLAANKIREDGLMNILVVAYACEPFASSEPGVGWNFLKEISKFSRVWVVTRSNNKPAIDKAAASGMGTLAGRITWIYVDLPTWVTRIKNKIPLGTQAYYSLWQWWALAVCRRIQQTVKFDLVHHLTFGVTWLAPVIFFWVFRLSGDRSVAEIWFPEK